MKTLIAIVDGCGNITFRNPDAEYVDVLKEAARVAVHEWEVFLLRDSTDDGLWHIGRCLATVGGCVAVATAPITHWKCVNMVTTPA